MDITAACTAALVSLLPAAILTATALTPTAAPAAAEQWRHVVAGIADSATTAAQAQAMIAEQVDELTRGRDCWVPAGSKPAGVIPSEILVRGARVDSGVVRVVTFDDGWRLAKSGDVFVVGACA
jgi:hypothetical protein